MDAKSIKVLGQQTKAALGIKPGEVLEFLAIICDIVNQKNPLAPISFVLAEETHNLSPEALGCLETAEEACLEIRDLCLALQRLEVPGLLQAMSQVDRLKPAIQNEAAIRAAAA